MFLVLKRLLAPIQTLMKALRSVSSFYCCCYASTLSYYWFIYFPFVSILFQACGSDSFLIKCFCFFSVG